MAQLSQSTEAAHTGSRFQRVTDWVVTRLGETEAALFRIIAASLFWVSQIMSVGCSRWFYTKFTNSPAMANMFTAVSEMMGGYFAWILLHRMEENAKAKGKYQKKPIWLAAVGTGFSIMYEGFIVWAYLYEYRTQLALCKALGLAELPLAGAIAYALSLVAVLMAGIEAQQVASEAAIAAHQAEQQRKRAEKLAQERRMEEEERRKQEAALPYVCEYCGERFAKPQQLASHIRWQHAGQAQANRNVYAEE